MESACPLAVLLLALAQPVHRIDPGGGDLWSVQPLAGRRVGSRGAGAAAQVCCWQLGTEMGLGGLAVRGSVTILRGTVFLGPAVLCAGTLRVFACW